MPALSRPTRFYNALAALLGGVLAGAPASAQSFGISPTLLEIAPGRRGAVLTIVNATTASIDIQIRPYDWRQMDGHDTLTDSTTLLVSPSIVTIPAGGSQVVRALVAVGPRSSEGNWRVILDQLPQAKPDQGMQVRVRMSIPVFAYASNPEAPNLRWIRTGDRLEVVNLGQRYLRVGSLAVRTRDGVETALALGETPYFLPGSRRQWSEPAAARAGSQVVVNSDTASFLMPIALAPTP